MPHILFNDYKMNACLRSSHHLPVPWYDGLMLKGEKQNCGLTLLRRVPTAV